MTTDRYLIALAAQAMGRTVTDTIGGGGTPEVYRLDDGSFFQPLHVNPTTDCMGDALRLAVRRGIKFRYNEVLGQALAWAGFPERETAVNVEDCGHNPGAATRRAITRAAAEIARSKQGAEGKS